MAYGESAVGTPPTNFINVQSRINTLNPAFSLLLGDNVYESGTHQELDLRFDPAINPALTQYIDNHIDYYAMGNHDVATANGQPTRDNYSVPIPVLGTTSPVPGPVGETPEGNYSWDYGNVHFLTFDSNGWSNATRLQRQLDWAVADLTASTAQWKVVYAHHPLASLVGTTTHDPSDNYYQSVVREFRQVGVDIMLTGHAHDYQRSYPLLGQDANNQALYVLDTDNQYAKGAGLVHVLAGTGGASLLSGTFPSNSYVAKGMSRSTIPPADYGFLRIDVTPSALTVRYVAADDSAVLDSFSIVAGPPTVSQPAVVATAPANGSLLRFGPSEIRVDFSQAMNQTPALLAPSDLRLGGPGLGSAAVTTADWLDADTARFLVAGTWGNGTVTVQMDAGSLQNVSGQGLVAYSGDFTVDSVGPSADIVDVSPDPRGLPVSAVSVRFTEAVFNLDLADFSLTRDGGNNLLTGVETLTTADNVNWTLGNLSDLTGTTGTYRLTLRTADSGVVDRVGNPLVADAEDSWDVVPDATRAYYLSTSSGGTLANSDSSSLAFADADILRLDVGSSGYLYSMYFDGSDVGLTSSSEDIDAFAFLADGSILISTVSTYSILSNYNSPGSGSGATLGGAGEDLLCFVPSSLGVIRQEPGAGISMAAFSG